MKLVLYNIVLCFICQIFIRTGSHSDSNFFKHSNSYNNLDQINNFRKPRFSFFNEFIEPLLGVWNDIFPSASFNDPVVDTENGFVRGIIKKSRDQKKYFAFLGIPYALPPIGSLRFEPPQKLLGRWKGIRSATTYASPCFHLDVFFSGRLKGQEDCLYFNLYTPSARHIFLFLFMIELDGQLPTLVYIHGGGYCSGSGDFYQGKYFMDEQNIILVVFNYRLSALGFLNTEDDVVRGNMALKDQNMLLRWLKDNIQQFGGHPSKLTLVGESVGAAMTQYHMLSHQSQGLFQKAISLSGSVLSPWAFNGNPAASAKRLAQGCGCPTTNSREMVDCLKTVPVQAFKEEYKQMMKTIANPAEYFAPSVEAVWKEDTFLAMSPREILKSGNYSKIPLMIGVSSMEGLLYTSRIMIDPYARQNFDKKFADWIPRLLYYDPTNSSITSTLKSFYFPKINNHSIDLSQIDDFISLTKLLSDGCFLHPSHEFAKIHSSHSPVHLFYNTHQGRLSVFDVLRNVPLAKFGKKLNNDNHHYEIPAEIRVGTKLFSDLLRYSLLNEKPSNLGTSHGDSVFLLFNIRNVPGIGRRSLDYSISKALIKSLIDFASSDDSHNSLMYNGKIWPAVKPNQGKDLNYMKIKLPGQVLPEPFNKRMQIWDNQFKV